MQDRVTAAAASSSSQGFVFGQKLDERVEKPAAEEPSAAATDTDLSTPQHTAGNPIPTSQHTAGFMQHSVMT